MATIWRPSWTLGLSHSNIHDHWRQAKVFATLLCFTLSRNKESYWGTLTLHVIQLDCSSGSFHLVRDINRTQERSFCGDYYFRLAAPTEVEVGRDFPFLTFCLGHYLMALCSLAFVHHSKLPSGTLLKMISQKGRFLSLSWPHLPSI